jgi:eukaryotic-like serine/threonine-protein kinase
MLICLDQRTDTGCGAENRASARHCRQCGASLRYALALYDPDTHIGSYRVLRVLGHGGAGAVYEAEVLGRPWVRVALKETFDQADISSFQAEFAALRWLAHPNLPVYHEVFERDSNGYLVMELVPGQSLQALLDKRGGPLPESQVLDYALQLCDVLEFLHSQQPPLLHRDIKPANIRLTPEGRIKLVDFGLLKQGAQRTRRTIRGFGTPAYAPVEQYGGDGRHTDARSDIYSLGATLYHLLTGQEPPPATARIAVSPDPLAPPRQINPGLSERTADAITAAMSLAQRDRYPDVAALRQALLGHAAPAAPRLPSLTVSVMPLRVLVRSRDSIMDIAWSPDGLALAAGCSDGVVRVWSAGDGKLLQGLYGHTDVITGVDYSPDGQVLASGSVDGTVRLWRTSDWSQMAELSWRVGQSSSVAFSPNGQVLAGGSVEGTISLWMLRDGSAHNASVWPLKHRGGVSSLAWSADGLVLVSGGMTGTLHLWQVGQGASIGMPENHTAAVTSLAWSPDGMVLASADEDSTVVLRRLDYEEAVPVSFADLGRQSEMRIIDCSTRHVLRGHVGEVACVAWRPDGRLLATCGRDTTVRLWDVETGALLQTLSSHTDGVRCVTWSPDGSLLASAGWDKTVLLWQVQS